MVIIGVKCHLLAPSQDSLSPRKSQFIFANMCIFSRHVCLKIINKSDISMVDVIYYNLFFLYQSSSCIIKQRKDFICVC